MRTSFTAYPKKNIFCVVALLTASLLLLASGCSHYSQGPSPLPVESYFNSAGQPTNLQQYFSHSIPDFIIIGEHRETLLPKQVTLSILLELQRKGLKPTLGLEAISATRQSILDRWLSSSQSAEKLAQHLAWDATWGYDFSLYQDLLVQARKSHLPIRALNIPHITLRKPIPGQNIRIPLRPKSGFSILPLPSPPEQLPLLRNMFDHYTTGTAWHTEANWHRYLQLMAIWDTAMAKHACKAYEKQKQPVVILAGSRHVEYGYGIASRIKAIKPDATICLIMPTTDVQHLVERAIFHPPLTQPALEPAQLFYYVDRSYDAPFGAQFTKEDIAVTVTSVDPDSLGARHGLEAGQELHAVEVQKQKRPGKNLTDLAWGVRTAKKKRAPLNLHMKSKNGSITTHTIPH